VAQLAQFSQLEATTNMSGSLSTFVESMSSSQITSSANLIGGKVAVPDGPAELVGGAPVKGVVNLPTGADGVQFKVYDAKGILVRTQILGSQTAGDMTWTWNGMDDAGNALPNGSYRFSASAASQGKVTTPSVSTMARVIGVSQEADKTMLLQIEGGKTVKLSDVKRIDG
jgi:flagellar basal-body rod modification protein FlgD